MIMFNQQKWASPRYARVVDGYVETFPIRYTVNGATQVEPTTEQILGGGWKRILEDNDPQPSSQKDVVQVVTFLDETNYIIRKSMWIPRKTEEAKA